MFRIQRWKINNPSLSSCSPLLLPIIIWLYFQPKSKCRSDYAYSTRKNQNSILNRDRKSWKHIFVPPRVWNIFCPCTLTKILMSANNDTWQRQLCCFLIQLSLLYELVWSVTYPSFTRIYMQNILMDFLVPLLYLPNFRFEPGRIWGRLGWRTWSNSMI